MAYWRSLVNISPSEEGDYYIATINGEEKKVKWNGENFECNNVVAWLEPSENQTAEEAFREFHSNIANFMLQNPTYYTKHVEKKETIDRKKVIKGIRQCMMSSDRDEFETQCGDCPYFDPETTVEECMQPLKEDVLSLLKADEELINKLSEYVNMAGKQLKEQEGVKPKTKVTVNRFKYDYCGNCGSLLPVGKEYDKAHFCPNCGKSVKWE